MTAPSVATRLLPLNFVAFILSWAKKGKRRLLVCCGGKGGGGGVCREAAVSARRGKSRLAAVSREASRAEPLCSAAVSEHLSNAGRRKATSEMWALRADGFGLGAKESLQVCDLRDPRDAPRGRERCSSSRHRHVRQSDRAQGIRARG